MKKNKIINDPEFGYLRVDPIPTQEEVEKYYLEEFYSSKYKQFNNSSLKVQEDDKEFFDSKWGAMCSNFEEFFGEIEGLSLFDIGFGFAQAMLYFKEKGLEVSGLEPSPECVKYALSKGLEAYQCGIEDLDCVKSKKFDIVIMANVLEHLRNPYKTLINIKEKLLKKRGLLVIDVPNEFNDFQVIANKEFNLKEWWLCPPNHINYFSSTTLSKLIKQCGYKTVIKEASFPLEIFMLFGDVYVGNNQLGKECHNKRVKFEKLMKKYNKDEKLKKFYRALADLDLGRNAILYCTPDNNGEK